MLSQGVGASAAPGKRRNVLLIMTDQHTPGALGIQGDSVAKIPHLDELARSGVRFNLPEHKVRVDTLQATLFGWHRPVPGVF
jgi:hypothetical protein